MYLTGLSNIRDVISFQERSARQIFRELWNKRSVTRNLRYRPFDIKNYIRHRT